MKKLILSLAIVTIATLTATAQTGKGTWLIGGDAGFTSSKYSGASGSATTVYINPDAGYFFADDLAAGAGVNFSSYSPGGGGSSSTNFTFAPFVRYYFLPLGDNAKLFANGMFGFGSTSNGNGGSVSSTEWGLSAGPAFFLNEHTALEATLFYNSLKYSGSDAYNTFGVAVGFQIHIHSSKSAKK